MRYLADGELIHIIQFALQDVSKSLHRELQHYDGDRRLRARLAVAGIIEDRMKRLEILTSAPPPPPFRYPALGIRFEGEHPLVPGPNFFADIGGKHSAPRLDIDRGEPEREMAPPADPATLDP